MSNIAAIEAQIRAQLDPWPKTPAPLPPLRVSIGQVWYVRNRTEAYEAIVVGFQGDRVVIRHAALPHATPTLALRSKFTNQPDGYTLERDAW